MKTFKFILPILFVLFGTGFISAQTYTLSGSQTKGAGTANAKLECKAVKITKQVKITSVIGDNSGFWLSKGSSVIAKYWKSNDSSAIGFVLKPGIYYVYPNLKQNQQKATVTLKLK